MAVEVAHPPADDLPADSSLQTGTAPVQAIPASGSTSYAAPNSSAVSAVFEVGDQGGFGGLPALDPHVSLSLSPGGEPYTTPPPSSTADDTFRRLGRRPALPLLVYAREVSAAADIADIVDGQSFLMSVGYVPGSDATLDGYGAPPAAIGTRWASTSFSFRVPEDGDVVWSVNAMAATRDEGLYRYGGGVWRSYRSVPQRAMDGERLFDALDGDRVYDLWARLLGGMHAQAGTELRDLGRLADPDFVPEDYLGSLGYQFGVDILHDEDPVIKRERVRQAVPRARRRGRPQAIASRLAELGYTGFVREVWADTAAVDNWTAFAAAPSDVQTEITASDLTSRIDPFSGVKGQTYTFAEHGDRAPYDDGLTLTSGVAVWVNRADGDPLSVIGREQDRRPFKDMIALALAGDLPVHVFVRFIFTGTAEDPVRL